MENVFELTGVSFSYGDGRRALEGVSFSVARGESLVLLGANASGKSTLLHVMDGLLFASRGEVHGLGRELTPAALAEGRFMWEFRRRVGLLFQDPEAQLFCPTVREEIAFGPAQLGLPRAEIEERISDLLRLLRLEQQAEFAPQALSGGEKKKVAIAAVLALAPEVLLLDEPTGGLDPRTQREIVELLVSLHRTGKTLVTATHDLAIVDELATRVVVFSEDHRVAAEGSPDQILDDTELLLGVNLLHEHVHEHPGLRHRHPHTHERGHRHDHG
jgi:cobalt/nickel transport system ATP-binding protein